MEVTVVEGDLLDQEVDVIVNAWNRNSISWRLTPLNDHLAYDSSDLEEEPHFDFSPDFFVGFFDHL